LTGTAPGLQEIRNCPNCSLTFAEQKKTFSVPAHPAPTPPQRTKTPKWLKKCGQYEQNYIHVTKFTTQLVLNGPQLLPQVLPTIEAYPGFPPAARPNGESRKIRSNNVVFEANTTQQTEFTVVPTSPSKQQSPFRSPLLKIRLKYYIEILHG
jgi:hypothetical protein